MAVAPPHYGLGSNYNYFLAAGGDAITGLDVQITFAEPLISASNGIGFQLNTYALQEEGLTALQEELVDAPSTTPNWQQYVVFTAPGSQNLQGVIDNWQGVPGDETDGQIINHEVKLATLSEANEIPANATISITPIFDAADVITGITFKYASPGKKTVSQSVTLADLDIYGTTEKINSAYESPISALTVNIVGDYNGNDGVFTSGSGTIVYSAAQPLTVLTNEPDYTAFQDGTGETANTVYGQLPVSHSKKITQTWGISADGVPVIKPAVGHKLPIPPSAK
ncbi:p4 [Beauveria brongniartii RCEF 3172]|uniref:p4 n=1 Tax=Beauveria brongniartii RCEF 3172 TaxID=1081107 RepID=A0A166WMX6_9HYPO|nr:p4 [Beauveria brongniartii RCEF 3172]